MKKKLTVLSLSLLVFGLLGFLSADLAAGECYTYQDSVPTYIYGQYACAYSGGTCTECVYGGSSCVTDGSVCYITAPHQPNQW